MLNDNLFTNKMFEIKNMWNSNNKDTSVFKKSFTFEERISESSRVMNKYPDKVPIICEKGVGKDIPDIDKKKYLISKELTIGNFIPVVRKRIKLKDYEALFLMINGSIPPTSANFAELHHKYKDPDGYLYIIYSKENVFG